MKNGGESIVWALAFEFAPAAIFGTAVGFATSLWMALPPLDVTPLASGSAAFGAVWLGLHAFGSRGREFPLTNSRRRKWNTNFRRSANCSSRPTLSPSSSNSALHRQAGQ